MHFEPVYRVFAVICTLALPIAAQALERSDVPDKYKCERIYAKGEVR